MPFTLSVNFSEFLTEPFIWSLEEDCSYFTVYFPWDISYEQIFILIIFPLCLELRDWTNALLVDSNKQIFNHIFILMSFSVFSFNFSQDTHFYKRLLIITDCFFFFYTTTAWSCVDTVVWMHYMDVNKTYEEKA